MADIRQGRWTAEIDGDFVVFIIGARLNSKLEALKALTDLGGRRGMNHMLKYLTQHPEKGLLGYETAGLTIIQYWRSFEHLEAFAKDTNDPHLEVWRNYWRRVGKTTRTGIWHETYLVRDGRVRSDLQQHASARPCQGGKARSTRRIPGRSPANQDRAELRSIARHAITADLALPVPAQIGAQNIHASASAGRPERHISLTRPGAGTAPSSAAIGD